MSTFKIPMTTGEEVDSLIKWFWWTNDVNKANYFTPTSWDKISLPKDCGGLRFRKFNDFNQAMLSKAAWDLIQHKEKFWIKLFSAKYLQNHTFTQCPQKSADSYIWKGLLWPTEIILKVMHWKIKDGNTFNFGMTLGYWCTKIWWIILYLLKARKCMNHL